MHLVVDEFEIISVNKISLKSASEVDQRCGLCTYVVRELEAGIYDFDYPYQLPIPDIFQKSQGAAVGKGTDWFSSPSKHGVFLRTDNGELAFATLSWLLQ